MRPLRRRMLPFSICSSMARGATPRDWAYCATGMPELFTFGTPADLFTYIAPEESMGVAAWSDAHRVLTTRSAAEAGPYRVSRTPYLREIMDDLSVDSPVQRVVFKKCAQIGASELGNCWLGYLVDQAPGPILLVQPTVELAKRYSKQRIDTLFDSSDRLRDRVKPARARDSGNTVLMKEFAGGVIVITGANSAVGLRSMPVRFLFLDEVDAYLGDVESEGDPVALAEARSR